MHYGLWFLRAQLFKGRLALVFFCWKVFFRILFSIPSRASLRSWRYCVGARLKFWRRSRVPQKGVGTRRLKYVFLAASPLMTAPLSNLTWLLHNTASYAGCSRASNHQIVDKTNYCEFTFQSFICVNSVNSAWTTQLCSVKTSNDFKIQRFYREFTDTVTVWKPFLWNQTLLYCHIRQTKQVNKLFFQVPFSVALPLLLKGGSCKNLLITKLYNTEKAKTDIFSTQVLW